MIIYTVIVFVWLIAMRLEAQTNLISTNTAIEVLVTNYVQAVPWFREVKGKLYNTDRSLLWQKIEGKCLKVLPAGLLIQGYTNEPVFESSTRSIPSHNYLGRVTSSRIVPTTIQVGTREIPTLKCFLNNYPKHLSPAAGQKISFRALRTGTIDYKGETLELWDYGTPHMVAVIKTNQVNEVIKQR